MAWNIIKLFLKKDPNDEGFNEFSLLIGKLFDLGFDNSLAIDKLKHYHKNTIRMIGFLVNIRC